MNGESEWFLSLKVRYESELWHLPRILWSAAIVESHSRRRWTPADIAGGVASSTKTLNRGGARAGGSPGLHDALGFHRAREVAVVVVAPVQQMDFLKAG